MPLDGRTAVSGRHMRTRFTWFVFRVYGLCGLLFVLSLIYQNNLTYLLAILLFFIGFYISYLSTKQLYGLVLEVIAEQEYFAGEPITLTLRVVPPLKWPRIIELYMDAEHMPEALDWQTWSIDASNMTFKCSIPPQPRGKLPPLILHCSSAAPFGQVRCEVCWRYESDIVVYPQPVKPALAADTSSIQTDGDVASAGLQGEDLAFCCLIRQAHPCIRSHGSNMPKTSNCWISILISMCLSWLPKPFPIVIILMSVIRINWLVCCAIGS